VLNLGHVLISRDRLPEQLEGGERKMTPESNLRYLTAGEVAAQLRVSLRTVRWLIRTEQLTAQRICKEFLIEESDLATFIDAHTICPFRMEGGRVE
jgi:excisionase family DNA binding protein